MMRSRSRKPRMPATQPGTPRTWNRPQLRSLASSANPTAAVGIRSRTASASTIRMPRLPGQRGFRPNRRRRRGARNSQASRAANTVPAAATRVMISEVGSILTCLSASTYRKRSRQMKERASGRRPPDPDPVLTVVPGDPALRGVLVRVRARSGRGRHAGQLLRRLGNADPMPVDHLPALPAGEQQDADNDRRQDEAPWPNGAFRALAETQEQVDQRQHHGGDIADEVLPRIRDGANARVTQKGGEAGPGRHPGPDSRP